MAFDFTTITELPDSEVIPIQIERELNRYRFGAEYCDHKNVLEVACGGGQGLGLLSEKANFVVGADLELKNVLTASQTYSNRQKITCLMLDAQKLPFKDHTFDTILIYEAIYYLPQPESFFEECRRVLKKGGTLIICTANKNWPDFNPSPYSQRYFSIPELNEILGKFGFSTKFFAAFPDFAETTAQKIRSLIKKVAVALHLIPKTMKGKVLLKKLFFGGLVKLPRELTNDCAPYTTPIPIPANQIDTIHTALFAVATLP